jgi:hypothetical protein
MGASLPQPPPRAHRLVNLEPHVQQKLDYECQVDDRKLAHVQVVPPQLDVQRLAGQQVERHDDGDQEANLGADAMMERLGSKEEMGGGGGESRHECRRPGSRHG